MGGFTKHILAYLKEDSSRYIETVRVNKADRLRYMEQVSAMPRERVV
jgi:hypothetical protein